MYFTYFLVFAIVTLLIYIFFSHFSAKWSTSNEEVSKFGSQAKTGSSAGNGNGKPEKLWTPANGGESPSLERRKAKDYKPVGFDGNSLQRSENQSEKVGNV